MRVLVPGDGPESAVGAAYADLALPRPSRSDERARVVLGMVASVDGATAVAGRSGALGGAADRVAFERLREAADAILVGAGTVRAEDYGAPTGDPGRRARRVAAGLAPVPTLLVVSGRLDLDPGARVFADPDAAVVVITHASAPVDRRAALAAVVEVVTVGHDAVDLAAMLSWATERGLGAVLCEGGPALNGALVTADLVDELFVTVAPRLAAGTSSRLLAGDELDPPRDLTLAELRVHGDELLARYRVRR